MGTPGHKGYPQGPRPCSPQTYSVDEDQGMKGVLEVLEVLGGPGAPHSQYQEVPEGQEGLVGPGCSLPSDPRNNKETFHCSLHALGWDWICS